MTMFATNVTENKFSIRTMDFKKTPFADCDQTAKKEICLLIFVWNIVQTVKEYANLGRKLTDNGRKFRENIRLCMVTMIQVLFIFGFTDNM